MKEFEEIIDKAEAKMKDFDFTYKFLKAQWEELLQINPNMRLADAIEIKEMYDTTHSMIPNKFSHGNGKKATKKKKKRK